MRRGADRPAFTSDKYHSARLRGACHDPYPDRRCGVYKPAALKQKPAAPRTHRLGALLLVLGSERGRHEGPQRGFVTC
jgi:hypothetical protein